MQFSHAGYQNLIDIALLAVVPLRESLCLCQAQKWVVSHQDSSGDHSQLRGLFWNFLCGWG